MTLSHEDIEILNAARDILKAIDDDASREAWTASNDAAADGPHPAGLGRLAEAADRAENSIFQTLNVAHSYAKVEIPDDLMYNRKVEA